MHTQRRIAGVYGEGRSGAVEAPDTMRPRNLTAGGTMVSCGASAAITSQRRRR